MSNDLDFPISTAVLGGAIHRAGFDRFHPLAEHVRALPYGRPADGNDLLAVLTEGRGTCSSKHRLLASAAQACGRFDIELIVGVYRMTEANTPGVGSVLAAAGLDAIPEAHCYLRVGAVRFDFTGLRGGDESPFQALLSEHVVSPELLHEEKRRIHHERVRAWAAQRGLTFERAWAVREACIAALG